MLYEEPLRDGLKLENIKQVVKSSVGIQKMSIKTLWWSLPLLRKADLVDCRITMV
jgi:hypothetical protein